MRSLTVSLLLASFGLASCADHAGAVTSPTSGPEAPINQPDTGVFQPGAGDPTAGPQGGGTTNPGGGTPPNTGDGGGTQPGGGGQPVPEPSTLLLVGTGLAGAALLRRRRKPADAS